MSVNELIEFLIKNKDDINYISHYIEEEIETPYDDGNPRKVNTFFEIKIIGESYHYCGKPIVTRLKGG
jgi:hypothetical protein